MDTTPSLPDPDEDIKIVQDPVYGTIHLDRLAVKIIDTPWFQRLRYIKQLAFTDYVYPGATHTRFAHSIGVYHLARQMIKEIEAHPLPSDAAMTILDKRCIRVAALCHDLGHGPFSHLYEQIGEALYKIKIKHEDISKVVMEKILRTDEIKNCFTDRSGKKPEDKLEDSIELIKTLIKPKESKTKYKKKKYMFQIVSNEESGVDVDKWDYFNRDAKACGVPDKFQYDRALSVARVVKMEGDVFELAYREDDAVNFYNMYNTRLTMYRKVYKHKAVVAMDLMIKDVTSLAMNKTGDKDLPCIDLFPIREKQDLNDDSKLTAFQDLNDSVLFTLAKANTTAEALFNRIHKRSLYVMLIDILIPEGKEKEVEEKMENLIKSHNKANVEIKVEEKMENLIKSHNVANVEVKVEEKMENLIKSHNIANVEIKKITFNYGDEGNDPISKLCFYRKGENVGFKTSGNRVSAILPRSFQEVHLRAYDKAETINNEKLMTGLKELKESLSEDAKGGSVSRAELKESLGEDAKGGSVSQADSNVQEPASKRAKTKST